MLSAEAYEKLLEELETERTLNSTHQGLLEALRSGQVSASELVAGLKPDPLGPATPAREAFAQLDRRFDGTQEEEGFMTYEIELHPRAIADLDAIEQALSACSERDGPPDLRAPQGRHSQLG